MRREIKEDPSLLAIIVFAFIILFSAVVHSFKNEKLTEQDYYYKFCTKYYDVSCDNIKIK